MRLMTFLAVRRGVNQLDIASSCETGHLFEELSREVLPAPPSTRRALRNVFQPLKQQVAKIELLCCQWNGESYEMMWFEP